MNFNIILFLIIFILFLFLSSSYTLKCGQKDTYSNTLSEGNGRGGVYYKINAINKYAPNRGKCEFNYHCLWDISRWVPMKDGTQGMCTLGGLACPAFSIDHDRLKYLGKAPDVLGTLYNDYLKYKNYHKFNTIANHYPDS